MQESREKLEDEDKLRTYRQTTEPRKRLRMILVLLNELDGVNYNETLIELCDDGIGLSKRLGQQRYLAYSMSAKARYVNVKISLLLHKKKELTMLDDRFEFALESEKYLYNKLCDEISKNEEMCTKLVGDAMVIAETNGYVDTSAYIHDTYGQIYSSKFLNCKMLFLNQVSAKIIRYKFLRKLNLDFYLAYNRQQKKELLKYVKLCEEHYMEAAKLYNQIGAYAYSGYMLSNLSHAMCICFRFRKARKYIRLAEKIEQEHRDPLLKNRIDSTKEQIKSRNDNIPNYIEGERRNDLI